MSVQTDSDLEQNHSIRSVDKSGPTAYSPTKRDLVPLLPLHQQLQTLITPVCYQGLEWLEDFICRGSFGSNVKIVPPTMKAATIKTIDALGPPTHRHQSYHAVK